MAIHKYSLVEYLFISFAYFLLGPIVFFTIELYEFFVILETSLLSDTCFANIFSQSISCFYMVFFGRGGATRHVGS